MRLPPCTDTRAPEPPRTDVRLVPSLRTVARPPAESRVAAPFPSEPRRGGATFTIAHRARLARTLARTRLCAGVLGSCDQDSIRRRVGRNDRRSLSASVSHGRSSLLERHLPLSQLVNRSRPGRGPGRNRLLLERSVGPLHR